MKIQVELIFDFSDEKKSEAYPLRYTEDFFSSQNLKGDLRATFVAGGLRFLRAIIPNESVLYRFQSF